MSEPGSICIAANDFAHVVRNGGIGTHNWILAHVLAGVGWRVHVLYCGPVEDREALARLPGRLAARGIGFSTPEPVDEPEPTLNAREPEFLLRSERVRSALVRLDREHGFDLIEFADWGGVGFRSIQAKLAGLGLAHARTIVKPHSPSSWNREGARRWTETANDLRLDFCERYAFENADVQLSPSHHMLAYVRALGWAAEKAAVLPYPRPQPLPSRPGQDAEPREIVFFGRLERLKGLELFVEAARHLDRDIPLTFLGKDVERIDGRPASKWIRAQLDGRRLSLLTNLNREQALAYLTQGERLTVMPSLLDHSPFAVIECAVNGVPFVAARVGAIPELLPDDELQASVLFEPNAADLLRCLEAYLGARPSHRLELVERTRALVDVDRTNSLVADRYAELARRPRKRLASTGGAGREKPLVSVMVTSGDFGSYLPEALASLANQTYPNLEVLVADDESTDEATRVEKWRRESPNARFVSAPDRSADLNLCLAEAQGEYVIPMGADAAATPDMVQRLAEALHRRPHLAAVTSYYRMLDRPSGRKGRTCAVRPLGGPYVLASVENVYGEAPAVYRAAEVRAAGGFEACNGQTTSWETLVKLVARGHQVDVVPAFLFSSRDPEKGLATSAQADKARRTILRRYMQAGRLEPAEQVALWSALVGLLLRAEQHWLRYRAADTVAVVLERFPRARRWGTSLVLSTRPLWRRLGRLP